MLMYTMGCAVDPNDSDIVYVVYTDLAEAVDPEEDGDLDVFLLRSCDGGENWDGPFRINDDTYDPDPPDVRADQYYPAVCVDTDGIAHVVWYDTRDDLQDTGNDVEIALYYARVDDANCAAESFTNYVADASALDTAWLSNNGVDRLGDYIAIAPIPDGGAITVYMGTHEPDILFDFGGNKTDETIYSKRISW
jgi:hypothetical protein